MKRLRALAGVNSLVIVLSGASEPTPLAPADGANDIWVSRRATTDDAWRRTFFHTWDAPERVAALSIDAEELHHSLSADATTIYLTSTRAGTADIFVARRTRIIL